jgi:hypothetical protein
MHEDPHAARVPIPDNGDDADLGGGRANELSARCSAGLSSRTPTSTNSSVRTTSRALASAPAAEASSGHNEPTHADALPGVTEPEPSPRNKRLQLVSAPAVASALGDQGPAGSMVVVDRRCCGMST